MDIRAHVIKLNESRLRVAHEMQSFVDDCLKRHPGEPMSAEEREQYDRYNASIDEYDAEVRRFVSQEERERENETLREAHANVFGPAEESRVDNRNPEHEFRDWLRSAADPAPNTPRSFSISAGDLSNAARERQMIRQGVPAAEVRSLLWDTGSVGSGVPTSMARSLYELLEGSIAMFRMPTTRFRTASGENMDFPKLAAHGIATQVIAQGTAIGGTDPTFDKVTLGAYKYGELVQVASEAVTDVAFPLVQFVQSNVARAVGRRVDAALVTGSGSGAPNGVMTAVVGAGTIATGGSLIDPSYEKLVDLVYSVNDAYRSSGAAAWLMNDLTAGNIRKLRDGGGPGGTVGLPLWQPSVFNGLTAGQPDMLLGYPAYTDPNVASLASNAKVLAFGDFSAYYIREVGDFVFERSDDFAFNTDLVSFRGKWRIDGDLIDTGAINIMKRSV